MTPLRALFSIFSFLNDKKNKSNFIKTIIILQVDSQDLLLPPGAKKKER